MNILFFIHNMSHGAGTERVLSIISNELDNLGHKIAILSCQNGNTSKFKLNEKVKLYSLEGERYSNFCTRKLRGILKLRRLCRNNKFDVIVCVDVSLMLYVPFIKNNNLKSIAWEHFNFNSSVGSKLQQFARKVSAKYADALVVITKADEMSYRNNVRNIKRLVQIYNPIIYNPKGDIPKDRKDVILAIGRLESQKGFDLLLKAWAKIESLNKDWSLKIVGEGSERNILEQYIKTMKLRKVELVGYKDNVDQEYQEASIFVCSSRFEGFGMVLVEAQQSGIPIVAFDCPVGPSEIISDGKTGVLVRNGDIDKLAEAMLRMINDKQMREAITENAMQSVKQFDVKLIIKKWEYLLQTL